MNLLFEEFSFWTFGFFICAFWRRKLHFSFLRSFGRRFRFFSWSFFLLWIEPSIWASFLSESRTYFLQTVEESWRIIFPRCWTAWGTPWVIWMVICLQMKSFLFLSHNSIFSESPPALSELFVAYFFTLLFFNVLRNSWVLIDKFADLFELLVFARVSYFLESMEITSYLLSRL